MMKLNNAGTLVVLSGPSGTGKGTILKEYFEHYGDENVVLSISATTRTPRLGEEDGVNYFFKSAAEFEGMIAGEKLLEWANFCGNYYGTPSDFVDKMLENGKDVILEIEVQGAVKVMEKRPNAAFVFIAPPSMKELRCRIENRQTESAEVIERRMKTAVWEISNVEKYKYIIVNDEVNTAAEKLHNIICAERSLTKNNQKLIDEVCKV